MIVIYMRVFKGANKRVRELATAEDATRVNGFRSSKARPSTECPCTDDACESRSDADLTAFDSLRHLEQSQQSWQETDDG